MLVILRENVKNLGRIGDVVTVTEGYARNFLLPKKLVMLAEANNLKMIENQKRSLAKKRAATLADSEAVAAKMNGVSVTVSRKVGENEKLFGSVTSGDIAAALEKAGHKVEKSSIKMDTAIKTLGTFDVTVHLDAQVEAKIKVTVAKE